MRESTSWVGATATQIARAVQRGDATATGIVADHIEHAFVAHRVLAPLRVLRDGEAIAEAELVDEQPDLGHLPLAGVPVVVAENANVAGAPTADGRPASRDDEVVRRLRGAGAVVLGATKIADDAFDSTRNPWRTDHKAGGSAAAVAAGLAPIGHGIDGFGSVRVPAAGCGLIGFKPGQGALAPPEGWYGLAEHAIVTTSALDAALAYTVLSGRPLLEGVHCGRLRVGVSVQSPVPGVTADVDTRTALAGAARALIGQGHDAIGHEPAYPARLLLTAAMAWRGRVRDGERADWRRRCEAWFADVDIIVMPTVPGAPPRARSWLPNVAQGLRDSAYTVPWNLAGLPALTVPMGVRRDGLPASVQIVGAPGSELTLLAVAAQLEASAPWRPHAPTWPRTHRATSAFSTRARHRATIRA
jgi:amidase